MFKIRLVLLSLIAMFAVSAGVASSASANEFHKENGEVISGVLKVVSLGGTSTLKGELSGIPVKIVCTHVHNNGTIENVGGMGLGLVLVLFLGCTVVEPAGQGCVVTGGKIHIPSVHLLTIEVGGLPYVEFSPENGKSTGTFVSIPISGCSNPALNGSFPAKGAAVAKANNTNSTLTFEAGAPNNKLKFGGNPAEFTSEAVTVEMEGGGKIKVE